MDSNHRNPKMTDLQSVAFNHSATYFCSIIFVVLYYSAASPSKRYEYRSLNSSCVMR